MLGSGSRAFHGTYEGHKCESAVATFWPPAPQVNLAHRSSYPHSFAPDLSRGGHALRCESDSHSRNTDYVPYIVYRIPHYGIDFPSFQHDAGLRNAWHDLKTLRVALCTSRRSRFSAFEMRGSTCFQRRDILA